MQYDAALDLKTKQFEAYCDEQRAQLAEAVQSRAELVIERLALKDLNDKHARQLVAAGQHKCDLTAELGRVQQQLMHDGQIREKQVVQLERIRNDHASQTDAASQRERILQTRLEAVLREAVVLTQNKAEAIRLGAEKLAFQTQLLRREHQSLEAIHVAQRDAQHERLAAMEAQGTRQQHAADEHVAALIGQLGAYRLMHETQIEVLGTHLDRHADERRQLRELQARLQAELDTERQTAARLVLALRLTHATLSWRLTRPFRALAGLGRASGKNDFEASNSNQDEPEVVHPPDHPSTDIPIPDIPVPEAQPAPSLSSPLRSPDSHITMAKLSAAGSVAELLSLSDSKFVDAVYLTLLGRMPDVEGQHYYIDRTRAGFAKRSIVSQICRSPEGQIFSANLSGLNELLDEEWKSQRPLVGWLHRWLKGAEGNGPTERRLRAIENRIQVLGEEISVRFGQIEAVLETVHRLVTQRVPGQSVVEKAVPVIPDPKRLKHCSSKAKSVYAQIKLAATSASTGVAS